MKPPEWLSEFPFLEKQWPEIRALSTTHHTIENYDLNADWLRYLACCESECTSVDWFAILRQFRKSRLAFIAYQDFLKPLEQHVLTMNKVSALADLLIQKSYQIALQEMRTKYGDMINEDGQEVAVMVWALGKLGANELNYSSDVDLVILYSEAGESDGQRHLDAAGYFNRLGRKVIKLLDHFTQDGQVYRVDMRLRPFGSAGPLACSVDALQQYLQYEGREWERFAWMRARLVAGPQAIADKVKLKINPFIYRKHLDYTVFNSLAKIKTEITDHLGYTDDDLKHGLGGIRAVEFIVQSLQLVFAGRNPLLQGVEISRQIQRLSDAAILRKEDGEALMTAWLWLRKLENVCQIVDDQSTHVIPENIQIKQAISGGFGFGQWSQLQLILDGHRKKVTELFNQLFNNADDLEPLKGQHKQQMHQLMYELTSKGVPRKRQENIEQLMRKSFILAPSSVVVDFFGLVKKILTRPNYILMLLKEPYVHQSVLNLMGEHPYFVSVLQKYPVLLEHLFDREDFVPFCADDLLVKWQARAPEDIEEWMEALRYFMLEHQFKVVLAWSNQQLSLEKTVQAITQLAVFILSTVVHFSHQEITEKLSQSTKLEKQLSPEQLIIVAYGSAAVEQMTVGSDLDLVFIVDTEHLHQDEHFFAQKWVRRIIHHLTTSMYHGKLYQLDMQLRPNGHSGALVTTKKEFARYQSKEAWIWEHAALIKSKTVYANEKQVQWHRTFRSEILQQPRDKESVDKALLDMSNKLSLQNNSKPHHMEFEILAAILKNGHKYPQLTISSQLNQIHAELLQLNLIDEGSLQSYLSVIKKDPAS